MNKDNRQIRVLVSAYACEPNKGSEPGVGWNWVKQISKFAKTWVITRANNRDSIERELESSQDSRNLHFVYVDLQKWLRFWKKGQRGVHLYYYLWQIAAYIKARESMKKVKFDIAHHLTFGNIWLPTFIPFLNIPFIWGPIGGGERVPKQFRKNYTIKAKMQERLRDFLQCLMRINVLFLYACKKAHLIIARTEETVRKIPHFFEHKTLKMIETGIDSVELKIQKNKSNRDIVQILSVGRLIHWKGFDLAIKAFAKVFRDHNGVRMVIIGDGPDKERLQKICQSEHISRQVSFVGHLKRSQVLKYMSKSDVFLFPSLKEGGAWVLFEAILYGLPIVCLDKAGAGAIIDDECGIKVKPITPEQTITELADALLKLADDSELRKRMGKVGSRRAKEVYSWDKKAEFIRKAYVSVLKNESSYSS